MAPQLFYLFIYFSCFQYFPQESRYPEGSGTQNFRTLCGRADKACGIFVQGLLFSNTTKWQQKAIIQIPSIVSIYSHYLVCLPIRKLEIILLFFSWKLYLSCYMYTLKLIANWWACELVPKSGTTGSALAGTVPLSSLTQALPLWKDNSGKVITRLIHCNYPVKGTTYGSEGYPTGCIHWYFPAGFGACFFCLKLAASWSLLMHFIHAQWLHVQLVIIENN